MKTISICFVCLGNICRSPTAEGVMRHQVGEAKLDQRITVDSAGTGISALRLMSAPSVPRRCAATICPGCAAARLAWQTSSASIC